MTRLDHFSPAERAAKATPIRPLTATEIVTDEQLRRFARPCPMRAQGVIPSEDAAEICMILEDMAGELLAYRRAARAGRAS